MEKDRVALWDNLKFFLILSVVIGHFIEGYTEDYTTFKSMFVFIYAYHMPLFIFISGLFFSTKNIAKKCIFYISAGVLLEIFLFGFRMIFKGGSGFSLLSESGLPWFMFVIAMMNLAAYLLRNVNKVFILIFSIILAMFAGYDNNIGDYLYLSRFIVFFPFFWIGVMLKSEDIVSFKKQNFKWIFPISLVVFLGWMFLSIFKLYLVYGLRWLFTGRNSFEACGLSIGTGFLARLGAYVVSFLVCASLIMIVPSKKITIISDMGTRSIDVFFWHCALLIVFEALVDIQNVFLPSTLGKIVYLIIALLLTIVLSLGFIFSFPLKQVKKLVYKK